MSFRAAVFLRNGLMYFVKPITAVATFVVLFCSTKTLKAIEPWADSKLPFTDGLQLWLDAAHVDGDMPVQTGSPTEPRPISVWLDASGQRHDLKQDKENRQPRLQTDLIAGKAAPVVQFDGQDDSL